MYYIMPFRPNLSGFKQFWVIILGTYLILYHIEICKFYRNVDIFASIPGDNVCDI